MSFNFGEKIKTLRTERALSEDQFADFLGVTWKDIVNWESGKAYPPLEYIPKVAGYFNVTTDFLFGMDVFDTEVLINPYLEKFQGYVSENKLPEAIATIRDGLIHFPDNYRLKCMLMYSLFLSCNRPSVVKHYSPEIIELSNDILTNCTDDAIRLEAKRLLCLHYFDDLKDNDQAMEIARTLPSRNSCREDMMSHIATGDKKITALQSNAASYTELLCDTITEYVKSDPSLSTNDSVALYETAAQIMTLVYRNGDFLRANLNMMRIYKNLGMLCINKGDVSNGFVYLEKAAMHAREYDSLDEVAKHTSPLVSTLNFDKTKADPPELATNITVCRALLDELMKLDALESLRYDGRLMKIGEILSKPIN